MLLDVIVQDDKNLPKVLTLPRGQMIEFPQRPGKTGRKKSKDSGRYLKPGTEKGSFLCLQECRQEKLPF